MQIDPNELLTNEEAATLLKQKPQTLRAWRYQGRGPRFVKLGSQVFYTRADVIEWIAQQVRYPERKPE